MKALQLSSLLILLFLSSQAQTYDILILGIAQDAGYPQVGCELSCCKDVQTPEPVASLAIATENKFWLIDATPDFTEQYNKARKEFPDHEFAGIFITHAHIGHYTGLMYLGKEAMNASKIPVYCLPRMAEFLKTNGPWSQLVDNENIVIKEIKAKTSISLSSQVSITPIAVPHRDEFSETAGYLIASQLKKTIYIPDIDKWENWKESINDYVRLLDLIIIDGTFYAEGELPNRDMSTVPHPLVTASMDRFKTLGAVAQDKIYFIHFNHTNPMLKEGEASKLVKDAGYHIARTGMKL